MALRRRRIEELPRIAFLVAIIISKINISDPVNNVDLSRRVSGTFLRSAEVSEVSEFSRLFSTWISEV